MKDAESVPEPFAEPLSPEEVALVERLETLEDLEESEVRILSRDELAGIYFESAPKVCLM